MEFLVMPTASPIADTKELILSQVHDSVDEHL
jgi:hypothetical protein